MENANSDDICESCVDKICGLQNVAVCCSVLQCGAVWYSMVQCECCLDEISGLQSVTLCCSAWQCVALCCKVLHLVAVCCIVNVVWT